MYTKDELQQMDIPQVMEIANKLGVKVSQDDSLEKVIYDILDKAAIDSANNANEAPKKKRTRIAKKDTDKVYTVNGKDGENYDVKGGKKAQAEAPTLFPEEQPAVEDDNKEEEKPAPKKRGRKAKVVKEEVVEEVPAPVVDAEPVVESDAATTLDEIPEAEASSEEIEPLDEGMLNQLQEKMSQHKLIDEYDIDDEDVWPGDPGDGTDFITVVDIPIEDQGAIPTLDMFDRPMIQQADPAFASVPVATMRGEKYDFEDIIKGNGVLEILQDGYGFLRSSDYNYLSSPDDIYVSPQQIKRYGLKTGDVVECTVRPPQDNEKYFAMSNVDMINGRIPSEVRDRVSFEHLTPLFPEEKFNLCGDKTTTNPSTRIVDLFSPIGKGQRALIVAQPKTG